MTEGRQTAGRETDRIEGRQTDRRADRQANRDRIQRQCTTGRRYLGRLLQDDNGTGRQAGRQTETETEDRETDR